ncbi:Inactivated superfamily I helicase [Streptococcus pneumoniae]|nr:Inactivated superfamily I helicase [Streptococcus pneumoniae]
MKYPLPHYSYSQLSSFLDCPQTWYQTYVLKNRSGNKYTALGSQLHKVFELQGHNLRMKPPYESGLYMKHFNELYFDPEKVPKKYFDSKEQYIEMYKQGVTAIENYLTEYSNSKPLFVEKKFKQVLIEGTPPALGFIDRIDGEIDKPWEWVITDYKSGRNPKSKQFLNEDFQLAMYAQAIYKEYGHFPAFLRYFHPVINKFQTAVHLGSGVYEYDYKGQRSPKARFTVPAMMFKVQETVQAISVAYANNDFPKQTDRFKCKNCFHLDTCKPFGDGTGWNSL